MRSEDELAAVLAHEAAHVLARHTAERLSQANVMGFATIVANWVLGIPLSPNLLVLAFFLPHSRCACARARWRVCVCLCAGEQPPALCLFESPKRGECTRRPPAANPCPP